MTTAETGCRATVRGEFKGAQFGDARLSARLVALAEGVGAMPEESLPHAMQTEKALDAAYRFFNNDAVKPSAILEPHRVQTVGRMKEEKLVLVAHDTTSLVFGGHREGLGRVRVNGHGRRGRRSTGRRSTAARTFPVDPGPSRREPAAVTVHAS